MEKYTMYERREERKTVEQIIHTTGNFSGIQTEERHCQNSWRSRTTVTIVVVDFDSDTQQQHHHQQQMANNFCDSLNLSLELLMAMHKL